LKNYSLNIATAKYFTLTQITMRTSAKVLLIIGALFFLLGIVGFGIGLNTASDVDESWSKFEIENATEGSILIDDSDGMGELGVTFWVKGEYTDSDGNGVWDVCDQTRVVITENPSINTEWEDAEALDGKFYYEVDYYSNGNNSNCDAVENNKNYEKTDKGFVKIGRACLGCYSGTLTFESNQSVWVTYDDKIFEDAFEDIFSIFLGFVGGFGSICCGLIFLIIGGILAFSSNNDAQLVATFPDGSVMPQQQFIQQTPGPVTIQTGMSQPVFDEIEKS